MNLPNDMALEVNTFEKILSLKHLTTSYKLFWLKGLVKEIIEYKEEISFERIIHRMIGDSWYPLVEYRLNFGVQDKLYNTVKYIYETYRLDINIKENELLKFLDETRDADIDKYISSLSRYVPYRLLQPFFEVELTGMKDYLKNDRICELSNSNKNVLYKIKKEERL